MELQSEFRHALDVLIDVEMSSQSNVKSILAYVEVAESIVFKEYTC